MKRTVNFAVSSAAGNVTVMVLDAFERKDYKTVTSQLLAMEELGGEQVGFVKEINHAYGQSEAEKDPLPGVSMGRMEMCGLEFCGNATRSFALLLASLAKIRGKVKLPVEMSGADGILTVEADTDTAVARVKMPEVLSIKETKVCGLAARAADMGGILHVVLRDVDATEELFEKIKKEIYERKNPPALGVMFTKDEGKKVTPVVYVRDVDTTYFEGSCGSGATACAAVFSAELADGLHKFSFEQPAGTLNALVKKKDGKTEGIWVESPVTMSGIMTAEIEV